MRPRLCAQSYVDTQPSRSSFAKNFRVFWPKTMPANAEYWRMTHTPE